MNLSDTGSILIVLILTVVIHAIETLQYGVSFAGIRTQRLATAGSLFGMVLLASRTANMIQSPLLGTFADAASNGTLSVHGFEMRLRLVLISATFGSVLGALFLPSFVRYLSKGILIFVRYGSYSGLIGAFIRRGGFHRGDFHRVAQHFTAPTAEDLRQTPLRSIPWWFYLIDVFVTAVFATGVLASLYAGVLIPERRITAVSMSGIVNGLATAVMFLVISPKAARYVDEAMQNREGLIRVRAMILTLVIGKICGTAAAQLLLRPGALVIAWVAGHI